jgi:hypothetical protein
MLYLLLYFGTNCFMYTKYREHRPHLSGIIHGLSLLCRLFLGVAYCILQFHIFCICWNLLYAFCFVKLTITLPSLSSRVTRNLLRHLCRGKIRDMHTCMYTGAHAKGTTLSAEFSLSRWVVYSGDSVLLQLPPICLAMFRMASAK